MWRVSPKSISFAVYAGHGAVVDEPAGVEALTPEGLLRRVRVEADLPRSQLVHRLEELYQLARMPVEQIETSVAFSDGQIAAILDLHKKMRDKCANL
jgi:hypothetical protein